MAVKKVSLRPSPFEFTSDENGRKMRIAYRIVAEAGDTIDMVLSDPRLPQKGQALQSDPMLVCTGVRFAAVPEAYGPVADIHYEYSRRGVVTVGANIDPEWTIDTQSSEVPADTDAYGRAYTNTLGIPFQGGLTRTWSDTVINGVAYLPLIDWNVPWSHQKHCNDRALSAFGGVPEYACKVDSIQQTPASLGGIQCVKYNIRVILRDFYELAANCWLYNNGGYAQVPADGNGKFPFGWRRRVLNTSMVGFDYTNTTHTIGAIHGRFREKDGSFCTRPVKIDRDGRRLNDSDAAHYVVFEDYPRANLGYMGIT